MFTRKQNDTISIRLNAACTIVDVESDTEKLKSLPDTIKKYSIDASDVQELDTAYLQMLLSLKATADFQTAAFEIKKTSEAFLETLYAYGISFT
jgi:ABC-type transporter Mla MlaB component